MKKIQTQPVPDIQRSAREIRKQLRHSHNFEADNPESKKLIEHKERSLDIPEERYSVSVKMKE